MPRRSAGARLGLDRLERWFQGEIVRPHERRGAREAAPLGAREVVKPSPTLAPAARVAIYSRMYFARLADALAEDFPAIREALGARAFVRLARAYLARFPSRHYSLNALGRALPEFLAGKVRVKRRALLLDLARVELAMSEVFDEAEEAALSAKELAAVPPDRWESARLRLIPAFRLLALGHAVNPFLTAVRQGKRLPQVARKRAFVAVYRRDFQVWRVDLGEPAHAILAALAAGQPIGRALAAAEGAWRGERKALEEKVTDWFRGWVADGIFAAIELAPRGRRGAKRRA